MLAPRPGFVKAFTVVSAGAFVMFQVGIVPTHNINYSPPGPPKSENQQLFEMWGVEQFCSNMAVDQNESKLANTYGSKKISDREAIIPVILTIGKVGDFKRCIIDKDYKAHFTKVKTQPKMVKVKTS